MPVYYCRTINYNRIIFFNREKEANRGILSTLSCARAAGDSLCRRRRVDSVRDNHGHHNLIFAAARAHRLGSFSSTARPGNNVGNALDSPCRNMVSSPSFIFRMIGCLADLGQLPKKSRSGLTGDVVLRRLVTWTKTDAPPLCFSKIGGPRPRGPRHVHRRGRDDHDDLRESSVPQLRPPRRVRRGHLRRADARLQADVHHTHGGACDTSTRRQHRGFCHLSDGQEAIPVGMGTALTHDDGLITSTLPRAAYVRGQSVEDPRGTVRS